MCIIFNFTLNGERSNPETLKNGTGTLNLYDPDGELRETEEYVNGIERE